MEYSTEYLIIHEDEIDWLDLSQNKNRSFSLPEIRMFRNKIHWNIYCFEHRMNYPELLIASKYFDRTTYKILSIYHNIPEQFIELHLDEIFWDDLIANSALDEEFLFKHSEYWMNTPIQILQERFLKNTKIDLHSGDYDRLVLYLKLKN